MKIDLTKYFFGEKKKRILNRFSCSELYYLLANWTSVKDYIEGKQSSTSEILRMLNGTWRHNWIEEYLKLNGYEIEIKKVLEIDGLEIVAKCDAVTKEYGIEIKTSDKLKDKASRAHEYQAKWYCHIFDVPVWYIMQPVITSTEVYLKQIGVVHKPKQDWVDKEIAKIKIKYEEICDYSQQNQATTKN